MWTKTGSKYLNYHGSKLLNMESKQIFKRTIVAFSFECLYAMLSVTIFGIPSLCCCIVAKTTLSHMFCAHVFKKDTADEKSKSYGGQWVKGPFTLYT